MLAVNSKCKNTIWGTDTCLFRIKSATNFEIQIKNFNLQSYNYLKQQAKMSKHDFISSIPSLKDAG